MIFIKYNGKKYYPKQDSFPTGELKTRLPEELVSSLCRDQSNSILTGVSGDVFIVSNNVLQPKDTFFFLSLIDAVRRVSLSHYIRVVLPFFPNGRQDRACNTGEPSTAQVMGMLLNTMNPDSVVFFDLHNPQMIKECFSRRTSVQHIHQDTIAGDYLNDYDNSWCLVSPDKGAAYKTQLVAEQLGIKRVIQFDKKRDMETGKLLSFELPDEAVPEKVLIIDDIFDGGGTFMAEAKILRERGAKEVHLFVTHWVHNYKGLDLKPLLKFHGYFDKIVTLDMTGGSYYKDDSIEFLGWDYEEVLNKYVKGYSK